MELLFTRYCTTDKQVMLSFAPIIGLVVRKTVYRLVFVYRYRTGTTMKKASNTDMCMYLKYMFMYTKMMFTNAFGCISCITNVVITGSVYCQLLL